MPSHFLLDENFPLAVVGLEWPPSIQVTRLGAVEPHFVKEHEDWEIVDALGKRGDVNSAGRQARPTQG